MPPLSIPCLFSTAMWVGLVWTSASSSIMYNGRGRPSRRDVPLPGYNRNTDPDLLLDRTPLVLLDDPAVPPFVAEAGGCNGYVKYCNKRLSQVFWMGAHNALTDGKDSLFVQRNQYVDGPRLLDAGIRYLDIDTCAYVKDGHRVSPVVCHGTLWWFTILYRSTHEGLVLIKQWMDAHPREVIFLNFGDIDDFTVLNDSFEATPTETLKLELLPVLRAVFGRMAILRGDEWGAAVQRDAVTLQDLIDVNRRVIVNIGKDRSQSPLYWAQDDMICDDEWYPDSLGVDFFRLDYTWGPAYEHIERRMRRPCATRPQILNKLEFEFHTALGGTIDSDHVGTALATYLDDLHTKNGNATEPFFPFNLILTDHSDKWRAYYPEWHAVHLSFYRD
ncbi:Aste57867_9131 [Aphanomyces stellatus]|uniref:Aste57867_9131 protein n=1 Tax=Aphanomyces stellatus TaxID=120398 RepID=A0A485KM55_9STRA|nr:hypothetical protein As57867_009095 [Aphanomyces stellatus]VFT86015.1 Aste57867_9131 [Aphanomyces stellatus]